MTKRTDIREAEKKQTEQKETKQSLTEGNGEEQRRRVWEGESSQSSVPASAYLIATTDQEEQQQKELLYRVLGPVFFGKKKAENTEELASLFRLRYGIDVAHDFYEGDEHYEEFLEAQQAIAEGMTIYGGEIAFQECAMAELAEAIWKDLEEKGGFRRINTMLEE